MLTGELGDAYVLSFGEKFDAVNLNHLKIDGRNQVASGIRVTNNFSGRNLDLRNFYSETTEVIALHFEVTSKANILLENSVIDQVKSLGNGIIGDAIGASRTIRIYWRHTDPESTICIRNNRLTRAYGDDGDVIQIAQINDIYNLSLIHI